MSHTKVEAPPAPLGVRLSLIALLPLMAAGLYLDGQRYDPDLVNLRPARSAAKASPSLFPDAIAGLQRRGDIRRYDKDSLWEYINGHADYYIGAGFAGLAVADYGATADDQPALVVNLYDMGNAMNAFGVLVDEAGDQKAIDIGTMGFGDKQGLTYIQGRFYVQMRAFDEATSVNEAGSELARLLATRAPEAELEFQFPDLGTVSSTRYVREYYRGLEFMTDVLERGFERDGEAFQAFLVHGTAAEVSALVQAFEDFFVMDGMPYRKAETGGLEFFEIADPYEGDWFFVPLETRLVGVYAPRDEALTARVVEFAEGLR